MKITIILFALLILSSCIPLRIAPKIKTEKVMLAKKFKRNLPRQYAFIFEDPKDANEFYNYIRIKYQINHPDTQWNTPFIIDNIEYLLSFHETEIPTKTINLLPMFIDAALENKNIDPMLEDLYFSRTGNWYIAITISNENFEDCLHPESKSRQKLLNYLKDLRVEYITTHNYNIVLWKK